MFGYLIIINIIAPSIFIMDKQLALQKRHRIPEKILHLLELLGGVFSILFLMYGMHHKNRKRSYLYVTWFIAIIWLIGLFVYNREGILFSKIILEK